MNPLRGFFRFAVAGLFAGLLFSVTACEQKAETAEESQPESKAVEVHLTALGMHCDGCSNTIESTFKKMPGVDSVKADWESKDVYVLVDTTQTSFDELDGLIVELGFDVMPEDQL